MVQVAITARNPTDGTSRVWGLSADKIPSGNWLKDPTILKMSRKTGELWNTQMQLPDGNHKVYFIVSQTPGLGSYSGEALFDVAGFNFNGVDNDSLVAFDILVKNGKASRSTGASASTNATDITTGNKFTTPIKARLFALGDKIRSVKLTWKHAGLVVILVGGIFTALYLYKRVYRRNGRRRF